jgi:hypothetical protein
LPAGYCLVDPNRRTAKTPAHDRAELLTRKNMTVPERAEEFGQRKTTATSSAVGLRPVDHVLIGDPTLGRAASDVRNAAA